MPKYLSADRNAATPKQAAAPPPVNTEALLEHCMGNAALVALLFDKFEKQATDDLVRIDHALAAKDAGQTSTVAHALKGAAGALSVIDVERTAAAIEFAARNNQLEAAADCLSDLKIEVDRCLAYLPTARAIAQAARSNPKPEPKSHP